MMATYFHLFIFLLSFFPSSSTNAGESYGGLVVDRLVPQPASTNLVKRDPEYEFIHDISWQVLDDALFSVDYESITSNINTEEMITLECLDCWTMGTINATLASSSIDNAELSVVFQDVKASFDLALLMNAKQTLTIPIYERGGKLKAGAFEFDAIIGVDIVFQVDDHVNLTGGFQVILPNPAYITADLSVSEFGKPDFNVNYNFNGTQINSLPLAADASINLTASLKARIEIDGGFSHESINVFIGAGFYIIPAQYIVQVTLDEPTSQQLETVETFDMNFGYYRGYSIDVDHVDLSSYPSSSTTFLQAGPWTQTVALTNGAPQAEQTRVPLVGFSCPSPLSTTTALTTRQYTAYKCLISVPNCPPIFEQTIMASHVEEVSSVICPPAATGASTTDSPVSIISPGSISSAVQMTPLANVIVNSLSLPTTTPTGVPQNITAQFLPITATATATSTATEIAARRVISPLLCCLCVAIVAFVAG